VGKTSLMKSQQFVEEITEGKELSSSSSVFRSSMRQINENERIKGSILEEEESEKIQD